MLKLWIHLKLRRHLWMVVMQSTFIEIYGDVSFVLLLFSAGP